MDDENITSDPAIAEEQNSPTELVQPAIDNHEDSDDYLRSRADSADELVVDENDVIDEMVEPEHIEEPEPSIQFKSATEKLFLFEVPRNSKRSDRLRLHLTSPVVFRITNSSEVYTIDWTGTDIKVTAGDIDKPGCVILIKEQHLLDIAAGILNPQVAMLSDKIEVEGQMELAVYVFNLIERRTSWV